MAGDTLVGPPSSDFEVLSFSPVCSACKTSAVAELRGELGRSVVQEPRCAEAVGGVGVDGRPLLGTADRQTFIVPPLGQLADSWNATPLEIEAEPGADP